MVINGSCQTERQATLGRLTASLIHEINNPMASIQGMLKLASEDPANSAQVKTYLEMSLQETKEWLNSSTGFGMLIILMTRLLPELI